MVLEQLSIVTDRETPELLPIEAIVDLSKSASTTTSSSKVAWSGGDAGHIAAAPST